MNGKSRSLHGAPPPLKLLISRESQMSDTARWHHLRRFAWALTVEVSISTQIDSSDGRSNDAL